MPGNQQEEQASQKCEEQNPIGENSEAQQQIMEAIGDLENNPDVQKLILQLIENDPTFFQLSHYDDVSYINYALYKEDFFAVKFLLENLKNTPRVQAEYPDLIAELVNVLEHGAITPLIAAAEYLGIDAILFLFDYGAKYESVCISGQRKVLHKFLNILFVSTDERVQKHSLAMVETLNDSKFVKLKHPLLTAIRCCNRFVSFKLLQAGAEVTKDHLEMALKMFLPSPDGKTMIKQTHHNFIMLLKFLVRPNKIEKKLSEELIELHSETDNLSNFLDVAIEKQKIDVCRFLASLKIVPSTIQHFNLILSKNITDYPDLPELFRLMLEIYDPSEIQCHKDCVPSLELLGARENKEYLSLFASIMECPQKRRNFFTLVRMDEKNKVYIQYYKKSGIKQNLIKAKNKKFKKLLEDALYERPNLFKDEPSLLFYFISTNNFKKLKVIFEVLTLAAKQEILALEYANDTPLLAAIFTKNIKIVNLLLKNKADVNQQNAYGFSPLMAAIGTKQHSLIEKLLKQPNINVDLCTEAKSTCLMYALRYDLPLDLIIKIAEKAKADIDVTDNKNYTALNVAAARNNVEAVDYLLNHGADPDHKDFKGRTVLLTTAMSNLATADVMAPLVDYNADIDACDETGLSALDIARALQTARENDAQRFPQGSPKRKEQLKLSERKKAMLEFLVSKGAKESSDTPVDPSLSDTNSSSSNGGDSEVDLSNKNEWDEQERQLDSIAALLQEGGAEIVDMRKLSSVDVFGKVEVINDNFGTSDSEQNNPIFEGDTLLHDPLRKNIFDSLIKSMEASGKPECLVKFLYPLIYEQKNEVVRLINELEPEHYQGLLLLLKMRPEPFYPYIQALLSKSKTAIMLPEEGGTFLHYCVKNQLTITLKLVLDYNHRLVREGRGGLDLSAPNKDGLSALDYAFKKCVASYSDAQANSSLLENEQYSDSAAMLLKAGSQLIFSDTVEQIITLSVSHNLWSLLGMLISKGLNIYKSVIVHGKEIKIADYIYETPDVLLEINDSEESPLSQLFVQEFIRLDENDKNYARFIRLLLLHAELKKPDEKTKDVCLQGREACLNFLEKILEDKANNGAVISLLDIFSFEAAMVVNAINAAIDNTNSELIHYLLPNMLNAFSAVDDNEKVRFLNILLLNEKCEEYICSKENSHEWVEKIFLLDNSALIETCMRSFILLGNDPHSKVETLSLSFKKDLSEVVDYIIMNYAIAQDDEVLQMALLQKNSFQIDEKVYTPKNGKTQSTLEFLHKKGRFDLIANAFIRGARIKPDKHLRNLLNIKTLRNLLSTNNSNELQYALLEQVIIFKEPRLFIFVLEKSDAPTDLLLTYIEKAKVHFETVNSLVELMTRVHSSKNAVFDNINFQLENDNNDDHNDHHQRNAFLKVCFYLSGKAEQSIDLTELMNQSLIACQYLTQYTLAKADNNSLESIITALAQCDHLWSELQVEELFQANAPKVSLLQLYESLFAQSKNVLLTKLCKEPLFIFNLFKSSLAENDLRLLQRLLSLNELDLALFFVKDPEGFCIMDLMLSSENREFFKLFFERKGDNLSEHYSSFFNNSCHMDLAEFALNSEIFNYNLPVFDDNTKTAFAYFIATKNYSFAKIALQKGISIYQPFDDDYTIAEYFVCHESELKLFLEEDGVMDLLLQQALAVDHNDLRDAIVFNADTSTNDISRLNMGPEFFLQSHPGSVLHLSRNFYSAVMTKNFKMLELLKSRHQNFSQLLDQQTIKICNQIFSEPLNNELAVELFERFQSALQVNQETNVDALSLAINENNILMTVFLLVHGAPLYKNNLPIQCLIKNPCMFNFFLQNQELFVLFVDAMFKEFDAAVQLPDQKTLLDYFTSFETYCDEEIFIKMIHLMQWNNQLHRRTECGKTVLHYAAYAGDTDGLQLLFDFGANLYAKDEVGCTALHDAIIGKQRASVQLILSYARRHRISLETLLKDDNAFQLSPEHGTPEIRQMLAPYLRHLKAQNRQRLNHRNGFFKNPQTVREKDVQAFKENSVSTEGAPRIERRHSFDLRQVSSAEGLFHQHSAQPLRASSATAALEAQPDASEAPTL